MRNLLKHTRLVCSLALLCLLCSCANPQNPQDPYEKFNRNIYGFNHGLDRIILRPLAVAYDFILPNFVRHGISNFFNNIELIGTIPNDVLQGRGTYAASDLWRLLINSTVGIGGIFDPATAAGLPPHYEDFGLTLATWGAKDSYYLTLPLFGPSTFRDAFGSVFDYAMSPWPYAKPYWLNWTVYGIKVLNERANLLPADQLVNNAFDPYTFVRDAYLQRRTLFIDKPENNATDMSEHD